MNFIGNDAVIGGVIESANTTGFAGMGVIMEVRDNGEPGVRADQFNLFLVPNPVSECPRPPFEPLVPVDRGNFVVSDAQ